MTSNTNQDTNEPTKRKKRKWPRVVLFMIFMGAIGIAFVAVLSDLAYVKRQEKWIEQQQKKHEKHLVQRLNEESLRTADIEKQLDTLRRGHERTDEPTRTGVSPLVQNSDPFDVSSELATATSSTAIVKDHPIQARVGTMLTHRDERDAAFDRDAKQLATRIRSTNSDDQTKLRQELEQLNERHFEYRQQQRQREIESLSGRIDSLRVMVARRQEGKSELLQRRLNDLIDPNANHEWDAPRINDRQNTNGERTKENSPEPTYEGLTINDCLRLLETERSFRLLIPAVEAAKHLAKQTNPQLLVHAILSMCRVQSALDGEGMSIPGNVHEILRGLPCDLVFDEFLAELDNPAIESPSGAFKTLLTTFIGSIGDIPTTKSRYFNTQYLCAYVYSDDGKVGFPIESVEILRPEVARRAPKLLSALMKIAKRDAGQSDWVIETSRFILELSDRSVATDPGLVPLVEQVFLESRSEYSKGLAAVMLGQCGLHEGEVIAFLKSALKRDEDENSGFEWCQLVGRWVAKLVPRLPQVVGVLSNEIASRWKSVELDPKAPIKKELIFYIHSLGKVGQQAREALPLLRSLERSPAADRIPFEGWLMGGIPYLDGGYLLARETLREHVTDAINRIEEEIATSGENSTQKPQRKIETSFVKDPSSLKVVRSAYEPTSGAFEPAPDIQSGTTVPPLEKTYDGKPYSQWLKMLETERKPEKLAMAIDACGRLAEPQDERRIAKGIFLAAGLFETANYDEQTAVWSKGFIALSRLSGDAVVDELVAALRDTVSYKKGRLFQGTFLMENPPKPKSIVDSLKGRADDVIIELTRIIAENKKGTDELLAGASIVWQSTGRPLSQFETLQPLIMKAINDGPTMEHVGYSNEDIAWTWQVLAIGQVETAPETLDLALTLMKHARKSLKVIELIGKMGRYAENAVPQLVDLFLEDWNFLEADDRKNVGSGGSGGHRNQQLKLKADHSRSRCLQIIETLGKIGVDAKGYALLRQLNLTASPPDWRADVFEKPLFKSIAKALREITAIPNFDQHYKLLGDASLINGHWNARYVSFQDVREETKVSIYRDGQFFCLANGKDSLLPLFHNIPGYPTNQLDTAKSNIIGFEIDETTVPKQFSIYPHGPNVDSNGKTRRDVLGTRLDGIYELTETTLRIQVAKNGEPRPTELMTDKTKLPEGQLLLELDRELKIDPEELEDSK